ncbi:MAG: CHAP domain-containing protein, partial [Microbacteriaceae bacterium]
NLVVRTAAGTAKWATNTAGHAGSNVLEMQSDGNLVIYHGSSALWSSWYGIASSSTSSGLSSKVDAFAAEWLGRQLDSDGVGYQCVDVFKQFYAEVLAAGTYGAIGHNGYAADIWTYFSSTSKLTSQFTQVSKTQAPAKGDIAIWDYSLSGSGGAGHVALVLQSGSAKASSVLVLEQNKSGHSYVEKSTESTANLLGYLRPKS